MTEQNGKSPPRWQTELAAVLGRLVTAADGAITCDLGGLAACRRGLRKRPMDEPAMWKYIAPVCLAVPPEWGARAVQRVEAATHYALALHAFHQQSRQRPMHQRGEEHRANTLGLAGARLRNVLVKKDIATDGVDRRFYAAATADSVEEVVGHLRAFVPQLREHDVPLDYVRLAADLAAWPNPELRTKIRRRWGLDYHWSPSTDAAPTADKENS
ncbi:hypothetical protein Acsp04_63680 [Actinomadura sp. NBRC 104425]|uniref:type I-E CRISPR-associated protein Cse2/CasB n=1 Tax=Actinomadura sp. NBRC 104425 TaxID=3032204 RepID=UPI0024A20068|nr:type I-E CRISPR-associated protein Cse2/CasB [Actinomadura sp. NBRC 104425]GLZ16133.1 hypothetical protein Acsp04_63680 [Actinomadura sp. NBRC 104425]